MDSYSDDVIKDKGDEIKPRVTKPEHHNTENTEQRPNSENSETKTNTNIRHNTRLTPVSPFDHFSPEYHQQLTSAITQILNQSPTTPIISLSRLKQSLSHQLLPSSSLLRWLRTPSFHSESFDISNDGQRVALTGHLSQHEKTPVHFVPRVPSASWKANLLEEAETWQVELDVEDVEPKAMEDETVHIATADEDLFLSTLVATHQIPSAPSPVPSAEPNEGEDFIDSVKHPKKKKKKAISTVHSLTPPEPLATALAECVPTFKIPATLLRLSPDARRHLMPHVTLLTAATAFPNILDVVKENGTLLVRLQPFFKHLQRGTANVLYPSAIVAEGTNGTKQKTEQTTGKRSEQQQSRTAAKIPFLVASAMDLTAPSFPSPCDMFNQLINTSAFTPTASRMNPSEISDKFPLLRGKCPSQTFPTLFVRLISVDPMVRLRPPHIAPGSLLSYQQNIVPTLSSEEKRICLKSIRPGKWIDKTEFCNTLIEAGQQELLQKLVAVAHKCQELIQWNESEQHSTDDANSNQNIADVFLACRLLLSESLWVSQNGSRIRRFTGNPQVDEGLRHIAMDWICKQVQKESKQIALDVLLESLPPVVALSFPSYFRGTTTEASDPSEWLTTYRRLLLYYRSDFAVCSGHESSPITGRPMIWLKPKASLFAKANTGWKVTSKPITQWKRT